MPDILAMRNDRPTDVLGNLEIRGVSNCHQHMAKRNQRIQKGLTSEKVRSKPNSGTAKN